MDKLLEENSMIVKAVLDLETMVWESVERVPYSGKWELCDRAMQKLASSAGSENLANAQNDNANATSEHSALSPFYRQEMGAQHLFNPGQTQELLNYAGSATGGTGASAMGEAQSEAARTRNTSGFSSALDQNARDRARQMATSNAGIGEADVMGAKQLNQEGAKGLNGLYDTDTSAMLQSMGQIPGDINANNAAKSTGWLQNLQTALKMGGQIGSSIASGMGGG